ncbi:hypothetical protein [Vibrio owensii]|uniref:hypothetical protein n=1 Tax=Vibrio owensii TaxID=696485 RepID=UPI0018F12A2A|nr:hypothetical protein [Vibrio owensii]
MQINAGYIVAMLFVAMVSRSFVFFGNSTVIPTLSALLISIFSLILFDLKINLKSIFLISISIIYVLFVSLVNEASIVGVVKVLSCLTILIITRAIASKLFLMNPERCLKLLNILSFGFIFYLLIEALIRINYGDILSTNVKVYNVDNLDGIIYQGGFYKYKLGSPFFQDSNFAGLFSLATLILVMELSRYTKTFIKLKYALLTLIIVITLSRALYVSVLVMLLYVKFLDDIAFRKLIIYLIISLFISYISIFAILTIFQHDHSFMTKFKVWGDLYNKSFEIDVFSLLFGHGFDIGKYIFSYNQGSSSHSMIPQLIGEIGLIGTIAYIILLYIYLRRANYGALYFSIILLIGFSLFDPWEPMYFLVIGLITGLNYKVREFRS